MGVSTPLHVCCAEAEQQQLAQMVSRLSDADREKVRVQGLELSKEQEKAGDLSCLPTLHIAEVYVRVGDGMRMGMVCMCV